MARNQLPEGVGKKIVEALKRQAEADITPVDDNESLLSNSVPLTNINEVEVLNNESDKEELETFDNLIVEEDIPSLKESETSQEPIINDSITEENENIINEININTKPEQITVNKQIKEEPKIMSGFNVTPQPQILKQTNFEQEKNKTIFVQPNQINLPSNVSVLRNLIASLPAGVSKQTGALIIKQTLEAMGIPMNNVLKEAQEVQEQLNISTRECMIKIQEYKTNIMQLEQSVQDYQKTVTQINDLVSLFLMTDK